MTSPRTICVVEDDPAIRRGLVDSLEFAGFRVLACADGVSARRTLTLAKIDLVLLDVVLPGLDGLDYLPTLRAERPMLPVILVTARGAEEDRVRGLRTGADDYVVKPFHLPELVARVRGLLRRSGRAVEGGFARHKDLWIDLETRRAGRGDEADHEVFTLKPREFELLAFLMRHPGRAWTRDQLLDRVWGNEYKGDARTVDLHVRRLRSKIELDAADPHYIETVWGVGYRMAEAPE